jgi:hypothetical protein
MIAAKFEGFEGGLAIAIRKASVEAREARTAHNRAMRAYRNERRNNDKSATNLKENGNEQ